MCGPFVVKFGKDDIKGYVQVNNFELDRTDVDTAEGPKKMKKQLDDVKLFWKNKLSEEIINDTTSFRYELSSEQIGEISQQISNAIRLMPFVLVINDRIREIEIRNYHSKEHFTLKKTAERSHEALAKEGWSRVTEKILLTNHNAASTPPTPYTCTSLQSSKGDVIIIPPFPKTSGDIYEKSKNK